MLELILLRHGQTPCGAAEQYCGDCPTELTQAGCAMAAAFAERYGSETWHGLYVSPLRRAQQTASPFAKAAGLTATVLPGLTELHYGAWDGRTAESLRGEPGYSAWHADPAGCAPPGGETGAAVAQRVLAAVAAIRAQHSRGRVLVVSHKATLRLLLCALLGIPLTDFRRRLAQPLGGISQVDFTARGPLLRRLGDISYLPDALRNLPGS